jgi:hypothetical protein
MQEEIKISGTLFDAFRLNGMSDFRKRNTSFRVQTQEAPAITGAA